MGWKFWKRKGNKAVDAEKKTIIKSDKTVKVKKNVNKKNSTGMIRGLFKRRKDLASAYLEVLIDSVTENENIKKLPGVKSVAAVVDSVKYIHQTSYIKRLTAFLTHFEDHLTDEKRKEKYRQKITGDKARRNKELKYILAIIEQYTSEEKAKMLCSVYLAFLDEMINWSQFVKYSETIYQLLPYDYDFIVNRLALLHIVDEERWQDVMDLDHGKANDISSRWSGLGLLEMDTLRYNTFTVYGIDGAPHDVISPWSSDIRKNTYHKTEYGDLFFRIIKKYDLMEWPDNS